MHQAAVGFQCPSCVAEGAKTTRSGKAAYGGARSENPALTSQILIGINLLVWLVIQATGGASSPWYDRLALLAAGRCDGAGGGYYPNATESTCVGTGLHWVDGVAGGHYWQLITSMFTHVDLWHIGFNMLALYVLGPQLESVLGRARFLALYLLSGFVGSVAVYWLSNPQVGTIGASGAIFGLLGGLLVVVIKVRGQVQSILVWVGINLVFTITVPNISWQGHLGGLVGGAAIAAIIVWAPKANRTRWQVSGLVLIGVLSLVLTVVRTAVLA